ncbi:MAG: DNA translocase FtsK 4TM domain-containing protein [Bacteroidetes bacterium]|nr:DNA translocase FtsK 4TM domain-containing protein [Bacteroidota bacterium]
MARPVNKLLEQTAPDSSTTAPAGAAVPENKKKAATPKPPKPKRKLPILRMGPRTTQATGIFFLFASAYLALAFVSFYINWFGELTDDYFSDLPVRLVLTEKGLQINNWMGNLGAFLSQLLVKEGFGLGAFFLPFLSFLIGYRLVFKRNLLGGWGIWKYAVMSLLWLPLLLATLFPNHPLNTLGGLTGLFVRDYLSAILGKPGLMMVILFILIVFIIWTFAITFGKKPKPEDQPARTGVADEKGDLYNTVEYAVEDEESKIEEVSVRPTNKPIELELEPTVAAVVADKPAAAPVDELPLEVANANKPEENQRKKGSIERQTLDTLYDPRLDLPDYKFPPIELLFEYGDGTITVERSELEANKKRIVETLANYSIGIEKIKATIGPTVTLYEIVPAPGIRISRIKGLEDDIALSLSALGIRIIAPIPGKGTVGIEVPNMKPEIVSMRSIIASERFRSGNYELPFGLGKTIANESFVADLTRMPHILMAGATGQGKSVGLNAIITSLLYTKHPSELKFVMVDPKKVELNLYSRIERHFLAKLPDSEEAIITDTRKVVRTLNSLTIEMDNRYELLKDAQVRNIKEYNEKFRSRKLNPNEGHRFLPYIVLIIDEFADLIMTAGKEVEGPITRLAQLARAVGIHLIIATQRPTVNIITGTIKANFPARIAFRVISRTDSRTILDTGGADQLVGRGDMLLSTGSDLIRLQCAFIDTPEVERLTDYIGSQRGYPDAFHLPEYADEQDEVGEVLDLGERDPLFEDAARVIVETQQGSTSLLQRKLKLGYNRAARIIDQLEAAGIVGPFEGSKAREVKVNGTMALEQFLKDYYSRTNNEK